MSGIAKTQGFSDKILESLRRMQSESANMGASAAGKNGAADKDGSNSSFMDHLRNSIQEVNGKQTTADRMATQLATGNTENLHETMLAATQAELSFNLMVQLRNKALEAYTEVMRMPV